MLENVQRCAETGLRDYAILLLILDCGLRRAEVSAIDVDDIELSSDTSRLWITGSRGGASIFVRLTPRTLNAITNLIRIHAITKGPLFRSISNNSRKQRLSSRSVYEIVSRAAERSGILAFGTDSLRYNGVVHRLKAASDLDKAREHMLRLRDSAADYIHISKT